MLILILEKHRQKIFEIRYNERDQFLDNNIHKHARNNKKSYKPKIYTIEDGKYIVEVINT